MTDEATDEAARKRDFEILELRRFWRRKWYDYVTIGNGAGLAATITAITQAKVPPNTFVASAWSFTIGVIFAGILPRVRAQLLLSFLGEKNKSKVNNMRIFTVVSVAIEAAACVCFLFGIISALTKADRLPKVAPEAEQVNRAKA